MPSEPSAPQPVEIIDRILTLRGERVLLDSDLAALYGVTAKRLNKSSETGGGFRLTSCFN
jgi:ORF6N domain